MHRALALRRAAALLAAAPRAAVPRAAVRRAAASPAAAPRAAAVGARGLSSRAAQPLDINIPIGRDTQMMKTTFMPPRFESAAGKLRVKNQGMVFLQITPKEDDMWKWADTINVTLWAADVAELVSCMEGHTGEVRFSKRVNSEYRQGQVTASFSRNDNSRTLAVRMAIRATDLDAQAELHREEEMVLKNAEVLLLRSVLQQSLPYLTGVPQAMAYCAPQGAPPAGPPDAAAGFSEDIEVDEFGYPRPRRSPQGF